MCSDPIFEHNAYNYEYWYMSCDIDNAIANMLIFYDLRANLFLIDRRFFYMPHKAYTNTQTNSAECAVFDND